MRRRQSLANLQGAELIQEPFQHNLSQESTVYNVPAWLRTGVTRFGLDDFHEAKRRNDPDKQSLVVFSSPRSAKPSVYVLPDKQSHSNYDRHARWRNSPTGDQEQTVYEEPVSEPDSTRENTFTLPNRETSHDFAPETLEIDFPRFLTWPGTTNRYKRRTSGETPSESRSYLQRILDSIHDTLTSPGKLTDPLYHTRARVYKWARETSLTILQETWPELDVSSKGDARSQNSGPATKTYQGDEPLCFHTSTSPTGVLDGSSPASHSPERSARLKLKHAFVVSSAILDLFLPVTTNHVMVHKCLGAFDIMSSVSDHLQDGNEMLMLSSSTLRTSRNTIQPQRIQTQYSGSFVTRERSRYDLDFSHLPPAGRTV
jgi:hypothetical protein